MLKSLIAWTRVHAINATRSGSTTSDACRAATSPAKGKTVWEHSPTRRKENELTRINRGVNSPINCLYLLYYRNLHVASHTGTHVAAWPPYHLAAPCARSARATRAQPRGLSAASQPELVPRATSLWLLRHVSRRHITLQVKPLFAIFLIRNSIYKSNKNQKKMHKTSEIHISQNTTPFNLKFSPLHHKFLPF